MEWQCLWMGLFADSNGGSCHISVVGSSSYFGI